MRKYLIKSAVLMAVVCVILSACSTYNNSNNNSNEDNNNFHKHLHIKNITVINPTCTDDGSRTAYCECGEKQVIVLDARGHDYILHGAKPADCTNVGWSEYSTCSRCNFSNYVEIPALGHSFGDWTVNEEVTCKGGTETRVCSRNEAHTETLELQAVPHKAGEWTEIKKPDCETDGLNIRYCEYCTEELERDIIPALGHDYGEWIEVTKPTCTTKGVQTRSCSHDKNHTQTRETEMLEHSFKWLTDEQMHTAICEACGYKDNGERHELVNGNCSVCGYEEILLPELSFVLIDGTSYCVSGLGTVTETDIIIPSTYKGLPVTEIAPLAFSDSKIMSITIPDTVTTIGVKAFCGCRSLTRVVFENPDGWALYENGVFQGAATDLSDPAALLEQLKLYSHLTWIRN